MRALGRHILVEFYECGNTGLLNDRTELERVMVAAAQMAKATVVGELFHGFNPHGASGVVLIAESHLSIHTWPEHGYAAVDLFTCGTSVDPWRAFEHLQNALNSRRTSQTEVRRGLFPDASGATHKPDPGA